MPMILNRQIGTEWAIFFRIRLVYLHHIVVSITTLGCTTAYNANTRVVFHTGKFSNKTSYCNMIVGKQQQNEQIFFYLGCG